MLGVCSENRPLTSVVPLKTTFFRLRFVRAAAVQQYVRAVASRPDCVVHDPTGLVARFFPLSGHVETLRTLMTDSDHLVQKPGIAFRTGVLVCTLTEFVAEVMRIASRRKHRLVILELRIECLRDPRGRAAVGRLAGTFVDTVAAHWHHLDRSVPRNIEGHFAFVDG